MAYKTGFFDAKAVGNGYAPAYNSSDFSSFFSAFISNGIFPNSTDSAMQVTTGTGMSVNVNIGVGVINGRWINNVSSTSIVLQPADSIYNRIDNIVIQLDMSAPSLKLMAVTGVPADNPTAPAVISNTTVTELCLATVLVPANSTTVSTKNITDTRADETLCGWASASAGEATQLQAILKELDNIYNIVDKGVPVLNTNQYPTSSNSALMANLLNWTFNTNNNESLSIYATEVILSPGQIQTLTFPVAFNSYCVPIISPSGVQDTNGGWEVPGPNNMRPYGNDACVTGCNTSQITMFNPWGLTGSFYVFVIGK